MRLGRLRRFAPPPQEARPPIERPFVVGLPRTGFTLLISIITEILQSAQQPTDDSQTRLMALSDTFGQEVGVAIDRAFADRGMSTRMMFNDNFRYLLGGPVWNHGDKGLRAYFRKYIGVEDSKDFTLITSLPVHSLLRYPVVYSHGPASDWADFESFPLGTRFASFRAPAGTLNSACFSINALASEYISRRMPDTDPEKIRFQLASYKLSSRRFFNALLRPYKSGLEDLLSVSGHFHIMHWEDIITRPEASVQRVSQELGIEISSRTCDQIWRKISYRNLTGAHRHNYRAGKAFVGDERETLVNEHIELMKESGIDELAVAFGYPPLEYFNVADYSPFQKRVSEAWRSGMELNDCSDETLFEYAFNKSNLDFSEFGYRAHPWLNHCRVERSGLPNEVLECEVAREVDASLARLEPLIDFVIESRGRPWRQEAFEALVWQQEWIDMEAAQGWLLSMKKRVGDQARN